LTDLALSKNNQAHELMYKTPESWVKITQHVFCPIFTQRWVAK